MTDGAQAPRAERPVSRTTRRSGRAASVRAARMLRVVQARFASSLTRRIVVLNLGGLVALLGGFLYLSQYQKNLIDARLESLETQGKIIAQVIADSASQEDTEDFTAPEEAPSRSSQARQRQVDAGHGAPGSSLNPERMGPLLFKFGNVTHTRARVYSRAGDLLWDSQELIEKAKRAAAAGLAEEKPTAFEEFMATLRRWMRPQLE
jgi:two-component system sensor histidine kinase ChvG